MADSPADPEIALDGTTVGGVVEITGLPDMRREELIAQMRVEADAEAPSSSGVDWSVVLQAVGLIAGVGAWVAVVGGARAWARMEAAGVPALATLAGMGQSWLVAEGLQTLLWPMLLGGLVSLVVYYSRSLDDAPWHEGRPHHGIPRPILTVRRLAGRGRLTPGVLTGLVLLVLAACLWTARVNLWFLLAGLVLALVCAMGATLPDAVTKPQLRQWLWTVAGGSAVLGVVFSFFSVVEVRWLVFMGITTVVVGWVAIGAVSGKGPRGAAITLFAAIVIWAGTIGFARDIGARKPELTVARVELKEGQGSVGGYLLGRSDDRVFLAQDSNKEGTARHVVVLEQADIGRLVIGQPVEVVVPDVDDGGQPSGCPTESSANPSASSTPSPSALPTGEPSASASGRPGTTGTPPCPEDDTLVHPAAQGAPEPSFQAQVAPMYRDEEIAGREVRLELLGLSRDEDDDDIVYLDARVVNMSDTTGRVSALLGGRARFGPPELLSPDGEAHVRATAKNGGCLCTTGLDRVALDDGGSLRVWAAYDVPSGLDRVDVRIYGFQHWENVEIT